MAEGAMKANVMPRPVRVSAFLGSCRGLRLIPSKWRDLVPSTGPLRGCYVTGTWRRSHGAGRESLGGAIANYNRDGHEIKHYTNWSDTGW